jgi:hypothetical protein
MFVAVIDKTHSDTRRKGEVKDEMNVDDYRN